MAPFTSEWCSGVGVARHLRGDLARERRADRAGRHDRDRPRGPGRRNLRLADFGLGDRHAEQAQVWAVGDCEVHARSEDLVRIGAYKAGADPDLDRALRARGALRAFVTQESHEHVCFIDCMRRLASLAAEV